MKAESPFDSKALQEALPFRIEALHFSNVLLLAELIKYEASPMGTLLALCGKGSHPLFYSLIINPSIYS